MQKNLSSILNLFCRKAKIFYMSASPSGLSGVMNSACIARDILAEKYPDRKIYIVDSLAASAGYGLLMVVWQICAMME